MKKTVNISLILLLISSLSFVACKKETIDPSGGDGTKVAAGANVWFRCKIDGVEYESGQVQAFQSNGAGTATSLWSFTLVGERSSDNFFNVAIQNLQFVKVPTKTFDLATTSSENNVSIQYHDGGDFWLAGSGGTTGTFTLTAASGNTASGTFSFTLKSSNGGTDRVVTEGTFSTNNYTDV